jgi:hypothetical protein
MFDRRWSLTCRPLKSVIWVIISYKAKSEERFNVRSDGQLHVAGTGQFPTSGEADDVIAWI